MKKLVGIILVCLMVIMAMPVYADELGIDSWMYEDTDTWTYEEPDDWSYDDWDDWYSSYYKRPDTITVQLNGQAIDFTDEMGNIVEPQIINNRTMVPMRKIFETFGASVSWDNDTKTVTAVKEDITITLQINNSVAKVNQNGVEKEITLDSVPTIVNNRTLVPVRFIAESLDQKVGWDDWNRTVIIVDTSFVEEEIKEKASNLYQYLNEDYEIVDTFEMSFGLDFDEKATVDREENSIVVKADGEAKYNGELLAFSGNINIKAKGEDAKNSLGNVPETIQGDAIIDIANLALYLKSPQLSTIEGVNLPKANQWVKIVPDEYDAEEYQELKELYQTQKQKMSISDILDMVITEDTLTTSTYDGLKNASMLITSIFSNDNFKVKEKQGAKIYTLEFDKEAYIKTMYDYYKAVYQTYYGDSYTISEQELRDQMEGYDFDINMEIIVKDRVATSVKMALSFKSAEYGDNVRVNVDIRANLDSYNQNVAINLPSTSETSNWEDVYQPPRSEFYNRVLFSGFVTQMGALQDDFTTATENARAEVAMAGLSQKSTEQLRNFVALGGDISEYSFEESWLSPGEARIVITELYKEGKIGMKICPDITITTSNYGEMEADFFVTPGGNVFCWPPFELDDMSYVSYSGYVMDWDGNTLSGKQITPKQNIRIEFSNGEAVELNVNADGRINTDTMTYIAP